ncbi:MAG: hypothetical protein SPE06_02970 [[Actinobacillus] rossii]|nr:hypothetical protein [[Actinobacillus] rossii]
MNKTILATELNNRSILTVLLSVLTEQQRKQVLLSLSNILEKTPQKLDNINTPSDSEEILTLVRNDLKEFIDGFNKVQ